MRDAFLWVVLVFVEAVVISTFLSTSWIYDQIKEERKDTYVWLGADVSDKVVGRADKIFTAVFKDTGIMPMSYKLFLPKDKSDDQDFKREEMVSLVEIFIDRLDAIWASMYQATQRLSLFIEWLPYLLPFVIPCLVDGYGIREIKKLNYGYASAVRYHMAIHIIIAMIFAPLVYMFIPLAIPPQIIPYWLLVTGLMAIMLVANIQKLV